VNTLHLSYRADELAIDLIEKMLQLDPNKRISAAEALKHPYFRSEPLPCSPSDLPTFDGDFHEYTVRKERKDLQNKQGFEKKSQNTIHKPYPSHPSDRQKSKPYHHPNNFQGQNHVSTKQSKSNFEIKTNQNYPVNNQKQQNGQQMPKEDIEEQPLAKWPSQCPKSPPKPKTAVIGPLINDYHAKPTPGLLSLVDNNDSSLKPKDENYQQASIEEPKQFIEMMRQNKNITKKKRDKKGDEKAQERGVDE